MEKISITIPGIIDFGNVEPGKEQSRKYTITNDTSGPIEIVRVWAACGCTKPIVTLGILKQGCTRDVTVNFKPPFSSGQVSERFIIYFKINGIETESNHTINCNVL